MGVPDMPGLCSFMGRMNTVWTEIKVPVMGRSA